MRKQDLEASLQRHAGGALVTIADISSWSGRSRDYLKHNVLCDLECLNKGTSKYYFVGDVASAIARMSN